MQYGSETPVTSLETKPFAECSNSLRRRRLPEISCKATKPTPSSGGDGMRVVKGGGGEGGVGVGWVDRWVGG